MLGCFNPFFIRASVYCRHRFEAAEDEAFEFQSLLHQGISLLGSQSVFVILAKVLFQSLLHQGISLLKLIWLHMEYGHWSVSIPSSSGHQFTAGQRRQRRRGARTGFNPFFIRASVYCDPVPYVYQRLTQPFQSLLHQGISLLTATAGTLRWSAVSVSIPSSSGHQFTGRLRRGVRTHTRRRVSIPSSSGHQFTGRRQRLSPSGLHRFNPFFIRASVYWISRRIAYWGSIGVSIPSSSGHQFTERRGAGGAEPRTGFQSLLHQGISLLGTGDSPPAGLPSRFQSLLHQGISLLSIEAHGLLQPISVVSIPSSSGHQFTARGAVYRRSRGHARFNPFFIRASVYWLLVFPEDDAVGSGFNPFFIRASVYCFWNHPPHLPGRNAVSIPSSSGHQFTVFGTVTPLIGGRKVSIPSSSGHQFTG